MIVKCNLQLAKCNYGEFVSITFSSKFSLEAGWKSAKYLCSNSDGSRLFAIVELTAGGEKFVIFGRAGDVYVKRYELALAYISSGICCDSTGTRVAITNSSNATWRIVLYSIKPIGAATYITTFWQTSSTHFGRGTQFTNSKLFVSKRQNEFAVYDLDGVLIENVSYGSIFYNDSDLTFYAVDDNTLICTRVDYDGTGIHNFTNARLCFLTKVGNSWIEAANPIWENFFILENYTFIYFFPEFNYSGTHFLFLIADWAYLLELFDGGDISDGLYYTQINNPLDFTQIYNDVFASHCLPSLNNCKNMCFAQDASIVTCDIYGADNTPSILIIPPYTVNTPESLANIVAIPLTGVIVSDKIELKDYCVCVCGDLIAVSSKYTSEIYLLKYTAVVPYKFIPHDWIAVGENDFECAFDIDISLNPVYFSTDADHNGIAIKARSLLIDNPNSSRVVVLINKRKIYIGANSTALISLHGADYVEFEQLNGATPLHITLSTADVGIDGISIDAYV